MEPRHGICIRVLKFRIRICIISDDFSRDIPHANRIHVNDVYYTRARIRGVIEMRSSFLKNLERNYKLERKIYKILQWLKINLRIDEKKKRNRRKGRAFEHSFPLVAVSSQSSDSILVLDIVYNVYTMKAWCRDARDTLRVSWQEGKGACYRWLEAREHAHYV